MNKYNKQGWLLCKCEKCGTKNYVEPHGTDQYCNKCKDISILEMAELL